MITRRQLLKAATILTTGAIGTPLFIAPSQVWASSRRVYLPLPWSAANAIVARTIIPSFPDRVFLLSDHGAIGDAVTDNTAAFEDAITACSQAGGGHVVVPSGTFLTGAIHLQDNVHLHVTAGAIIKFSGDERKFRRVLTRYQGIELMNRSPLIYAFGRGNFALTGSGTLDASATASWNRDDRGAWAQLQAEAVAGVPVSQRLFGTPGRRLRTAFVEPYNCSNVLIQGVTLTHAQFWQIHPTLCTNVTVDGVTTGEPAQNNTDACDPESCNHVIINGCTFSALDDGVAIKAGRHAGGPPSQNIVIMHSQFQSSKGMVACGSEESAGVQNVFAHNLSAFGSGVRYCLYLKSNLKVGGFIRDIHMDAVTASGVRGSALFATLTYAGVNNGSFLPSIDNININNMTVDGAPFVLDVTGLPSDRIGTIHLSNSTFTNIANPKGIIQYAAPMIYDNVEINGKRVHSR